VYNQYGRTEELHSSYQMSSFHKRCCIKSRLSGLLKDQAIGIRLDNATMPPRDNSDDFSVNIVDIFGDEKEDVRNLFNDFIEMPTVEIDVRDKTFTYINVRMLRHIMDNGRLGFILNRMGEKGWGLEARYLVAKISDYTGRYSSKNWDDLQSIM